MVLTRAQSKTTKSSTAKAKPKTIAEKPKATTKKESKPAAEDPETKLVEKKVTKPTKPVTKKEPEPADQESETKSVEKNVTKTTRPVAKKEPKPVARREKQKKKEPEQENGPVIIKIKRTAAIRPPPIIQRKEDTKTTRKPPLKSALKTTGKKADQIAETNALAASKLGKPIRPPRSRQLPTVKANIPSPIRLPPLPPSPTKVSDSQDANNPFKSSTLSPVKSLGNPIKLPVSAKPARSFDAPPVRSTPLSFKLSLIANSAIKNPEFITSDDTINVPTIGLSPAKFIGTPVRKHVGGLFSSFRHPATAMPSKRTAPMSPWRPSSARGEKRLRVDMTPSRPRTADNTNMFGSCLKDPIGSMSTKKSVSFNAIAASPTPHHKSLPRLSEAQESEPADEIETEPLHLSEILNIELSPEPAKSDVAEIKTVLKNVTFFIDVWGSDGLNCNQYFAPLLEELGARIVEVLDDGVTHVLFKDGSDRTLKSVSQSRGSIKCVNVGWVLE
jgi:hypothetical protein